MNIRARTTNNCPDSFNPANDSSKGCYCCKNVSPICALARENFKTFAVVLASREFVFSKEGSDKRVLFTAVEKSLRSPHIKLAFCIRFL